jgi:serine/threonine protein kinase
MSPEQQTGDALETTTDIYSLGVTFYEALAGKRMPMGDYEELSSRNEAISPQMDELIRDCLLPKEKRLQTAKAFAQRLSTALVSTRPLSEILAHGKLHELSAALEDISPTDLAQLPEGQRALILTKLGDITGSGNESLIYAAEELLEILLLKGVLLSEGEYREVVLPAVPWGFETSFGTRLGSQRVRKALEQAAHIARGASHKVIMDEFCRVMQSCDYDQREDWYLHSVRSVIQSLLANPSCTSGSSDLVKIMRTVNKIQRSRQRETPAR